MKLRYFNMILVAVLIVFISLSPVFSMDDPGYEVSRMVMAEGISDREPYGISEIFSADIETVFCFLETNNIEADTTVTFAWYFEGREMARVTLPVKKGRRWRTFSSKKTTNLKGEWTVELLEESGIVLNVVSFKVE